MILNKRIPASEMSKISKTNDMSKIIKIIEIKKRDLTIEISMLSKINGMRNIRISS